MKDRQRSSSLRAQILFRTLIVGLVPLVILASTALLGLQKLGSSADEGVAQTRRLLSEEAASEPASLAALEALSRDLDEASRQLSLLVLVVLVFGGFVAAAVAAVLTARIVDPIVRLTKQTRQIAEIGLPAAVEQLLQLDATNEPPTPIVIDVVADNELADLAESFNAMQLTAFRLAGDQATQRRDALKAFGHLGRRNEALVNKQLRFIDELERSEEDPERLAVLFRLDHLATRMRRSSQSVLVISGNRQSRPRGGAFRVELVVRGALGEVEGFDRIDIVRFDPAAVAGHVVDDVGHLIAELVDNALVHSRPESRVQVLGAAGALRYSIRIVDEGLGMGGDEITAANELLRRGHDADTTSSEQLGLVVVAKLAAIHGVHVSLAALSPNGIEARIELPSEIMHPLGTVTGLTGSTEPLADEETLRLRRSRPIIDQRLTPLPPPERAPRPTRAPSPTDPRAWSGAGKHEPLPEGASVPRPAPGPSPRSPKERRELISAAEEVAADLTAATELERKREPKLLNWIDAAPDLEAETEVAESRRLSRSPSARIKPASRRESRRPSKPGRSVDGAERPKRPIAVADSVDEVTAEAELVQTRWASFQQGRISAAYDDESKADTAVDDGPDDDGRPESGIDGTE